MPSSEPPSSDLIGSIHGTIPKPHARGAFWHISSIDGQAVCELYNCTGHVMATLHFHQAMVTPALRAHVAEEVEMACPSNHGSRCPFDLSSLETLFALLRDRLEEVRQDLRSPEKQKS